MAGKEGLNIAVVGATGAVGREMVDILSQRQFPAAKVVALASERSIGTILDYKDTELVVEQLMPNSFKGIDIALFSAGGSISAEYAPIAVEEGAIVIDNSSQWRMHEEVPLIVPEVNSEVLMKALSLRKKGKGIIIANPNCSTIQLVVILKPILDRYGIKRCVVSTYQAVSGAGQKGMDELWNQVRGIFMDEELIIEKFPHQIAFNCLPQIDVFEANGYTKEEMKVIFESRKILDKADLRITATAVRVPVFACHSESVNLETEKPCQMEELRTFLRESPGVIVLDDPAGKIYPMGIDLGGTDASYVGRIRKDESVENGINLWIVADNIRKGAALNAVQIAEIVLDHI